MEIILLTKRDEKNGDIFRELTTEESIGVDDHFV